MSDFNRGFTSIPAGRADMAVDAGLRSFMLGVYNKVALGLIVSAAVAYVTGSVPAVMQLLFRVTPDGRFGGYTALGLVVTFSPIVLLIGSRFAMKQTAKNTGILYWLIVATMGASLGVNVLVYTGASIATTFLITAAAFGALSLAGYTTKKDLTGFGSFLIVGVVGLVIAMVVNMFLHSAAMSFIINALGVFIFAGLIAYNTQQLKMTYYQMGGDKAALGVATNYGALTLYIDFINLFQFLMGFLGSRR
jgi:FtsH-binding integral membrane protein